MYRSPSQNNDNFDDFLNIFDNPLNKAGKSSPLFTVILGIHCKTITHQRLDQLSETIDKTQKS